MPGIRPSQLTLAEKCGLSAKLAEEHPEGSVYTERGTAIHEEIAAELRRMIAEAELASEG